MKQKSPVCQLSSIYQKNPAASHGQKKTVLETVQEFVHFVHVLSVRAVEPIGCGSGLVTLARFSDFSLRVTLCENA